MAVELSREDVREELRAFAQKALRKELKDFGVRLHRNICDELSASSPVSPMASDRPFPQGGQQGEACPGSNPKLRRLGSPVPLDMGENRRSQSFEDDVEARVVTGTRYLDNGLPLPEPPQKQLGAVIHPLDSLPPELPGFANGDQTLLTSGMCTGCGKNTDVRIRPSTMRTPPSPVPAVPPQAAPDGMAVRRGSTPGGGVELRRCSSAGIPSPGGPPRQFARRSSLRRSSVLFTPGEEVKPDLPAFFGYRASYRSRSPRPESLQGRSPRLDPPSLCGGTASISGPLELTVPGEASEDLEMKPAPSFGSRGGPKKRTLRSILQEFVHNAIFDWMSGFLVLVNAICIGWQTDYTATTADDQLPLAFGILDRVFCALFTAELVLRLVAGGKDFCLGSEWKWNFFDFLMVAMQLFEEITTLMATTSGVTGSNFSYLRLLRLLRLIRVLRIVRVLRFIRELRRLVCSIGSSLQSLAWTLVLIVFMLYVVGVCFTQLVSNYAGPPGVRNEALDRYFGSLGDSVLSLFQVMSGGIDWDDLSRPLSEVHWSLAALFAFYIAFSVLAMMNVVTGVFVDSAVQSSVKDHEKDLVLRIREFYQRGDTNGDGKLTWEEFETTLEMPGAQDILTHIGLDHGEARHLFELLDVHDDGEINLDEFIMGCLRLRGPAKSVDVVTMMYETKRNMGNIQRQSDEVLRILQAQQFTLRSCGGLDRNMSSPRPLA